MYTLQNNYILHRPIDCGQVNNDKGHFKLGFASCKPSPHTVANSVYLNLSYHLFTVYLMTKVKEILKHRISLPSGT